MTVEFIESRSQPTPGANIGLNELSRKPHLGVIQQHIDDALFLAAQRETALHAPHLKLAQILRLEERLEANLDGIRVAGDPGWCLLLQQEDLTLPESIFIAAAVAIPEGDNRRIQFVLDSSLAHPQLRHAFANALGFLEPDFTGQVISDLLRRKDSAAQQLALLTCSRLNIEPGALLFDAILSTDMPLQIAAFQAAAALGHTDLARFIVRSVSSSDLDRSLHSALACARLGLRDRDVLQTLKAVALRHLPESPTALATVIACMPLYEAGRWIDELWRIPSSRRLAVDAIAALGDVSRLPAVLDLMDEPSLARHAGGALSTISGLDLNSASLAQPQPEGLETGPSEDPSDPDVATDPDEGLPWPASENIRSWWSKHASAFAPGTRYLFGQPIARTTLLHVLLTGSQRQRHAAALELALLEPSQAGFPLYTAAVRQRALLTGLIDPH